MRLPTIALLATCGIALAAASVAAGIEREAPELGDAISPWTAPPYWTPPAPAREALASGRQALAVGPTALPFIALFPCRLVDTRGNAPLTGGFLPPATVRSYTLTGVCNVPADAKAISLNATVVHPTGPGFLTLYPEGGAFPPVSTLNYLGNDVIVNAAVVPLSATGGISMALGVSGGDVILDTNGYYASVPSVTSLNALSGDLTLAAGTNVTLTPSGNTLTIASTGGVTLAGSGTAPTASHSDHDHLGASWTGSSSFTINNTNASSPAIWAIGPQWGVQGNSSLSGPNTGGVIGITSNAGGNGVLGDGGPGTGVKGRSTGNNGVYGTTSSSTASGVYGENTSSSGYGVAGRAVTGFGVLAEVTGASGVGLEAHASGGATALHAKNLTGQAAWIEGTALVTGNLTVTGTLSKGGGTFKIDHPLDPLNKFLSHSFVESPDMMNIYNGNVTTDERGYATVELPEWFEALNRDFRYQLTVISDGAWARARVARRIEGNRFVIETDVPATEVSWQVTGIRKDAWAEAHPISVEEMKPEGQRGTYLHPEAFAKAPVSRGDGAP